MDRLEAMRVFLKVVETGSLSAAARSLNSPLPTVSRKISELEAHLGVTLITRTNRNIVLTEAGQQYVDSARDILERVEEVERRVSGEYLVPKGSLTLTAPIVFGRLHVLPVISDFLKAFPAIDMRLTLSDRNINLADEHIDIALRIGALPDTGLIAVRLGEVRNVVYGSPNYLAHTPPPTHPRELDKHQCVAFEGVHSSQAWAFQIGKRIASVPIRTRLSVNTAEAAVDAAVGGVGLTRVMSYQAREAVRSGLLIPLLEKFEVLPIPVQMMHLPRAPIPLKIRAFLDFASQRLRAALL